DTSVSGWQVLALKTAGEAGIEIDEACLAKVKEFFKKCEMGRDGQTHYQCSGGLNTQATTGVGMLVHQFLLGQPDSPLVQEAAHFLAQYAEATWGRANLAGRFAEAIRSRPTLPPVGTGGSDYYLWYNCSLAMFQAGGDCWERWNKVVRDTILGLQEQEGCARGSWPPANSQWGDAGGRIYTTALAVLTLQVYYRFDMEKEEPPKAETANPVE
ncbi:MAG: hypothetical protein ABIK89_17125, partial [Planctomycetota bacterium]